MFEKVLRVEVAAGTSGVADGVDDRQSIVLPQFVHGGERRVQAEHGVKGKRRTLGNGDAGPVGVVARIAGGYDGTHAVDSSAQEHGDEFAVAVAGAVGPQGARNTRQRGRHDT